MKRKCNKCQGQGSYRRTLDGIPLPCSRCRGTRQMDRTTKAEKRQRRDARRVA